MVIALATAPTPPDWIVITTSASGSRLSVRKGSITAGDTAPKVWIRTDLSKVAPDGSSYLLQRIQFSCSYETIRTLSVISYRADGTVVESDHIPAYDQKDEPVIPDSVAYRLAAVVCPIARGE